MSAVRDEASDGPHLDSDTTASAIAAESGHAEHNGLEDSSKIRAEGLGEDGDEYQSSAEEDSIKGHTKPYILHGNGIGSPTRSDDRPSSSGLNSPSIPDDTPSLRDSVASSPNRGYGNQSINQSPTPSLKPFDRRFQARLSSSSLGSPRIFSPLSHGGHSRIASANYFTQSAGETEIENPWEVVRWTKLKKITTQAFSETGKRNSGSPTCVAVSALIALGTSRGMVLVFDYSQNLKAVIGPGTKAVECGAVTSISISADHSSIAAGHASGSIFTWEIAKPAKPFLHIHPLDRSRNPSADGHTLDAAVLHVGFLGIRHTALASADDRGMAFSHLATRGMGMVARSVKTTRILGRYPSTSQPVPTRKPSSVLAFSSLPLGNADHGADSMGLVAMLTPYLLVVVSTMPIAQTQYKTPRAKDVASHSAMTGAIAWFPSVRLKPKDSEDESVSKAKLAYCWSDILIVLDVVEIEGSDGGGKSDPPSLQFRPRSRWKSDEAIVAIQWLSRSVLVALTITQQLIVLEDYSMILRDSSDLIHKHTYHVDIFSQQLNLLVNQLEDEEISAMHGVVADAFYMSFRAYKGRLFLLGHMELSFGTVSNWADRLAALVEHGKYVRAIELATGYYSGAVEKVTVGLPEDDDKRHDLVLEKLKGLVMASLGYFFRTLDDKTALEKGESTFRQLADACVQACLISDEMEFLFDDVYPWYKDNDSEAIFLERLEHYIAQAEIKYLPPVVVKDLINYFVSMGWNSRLEEILCSLDPRTMDIDQVTHLCKENYLYDALLYVWNQALGDYTTILSEMLDTLLTQQNGNNGHEDISERKVRVGNALFPYLSYIFTGRMYPTGEELAADESNLAKAELYNFFFSGRGSDGIIRGDLSPQSSKSNIRTNYPKLRKILTYDASSFLSMLNEAFEDHFLNGPQERLGREQPGSLTEAQKFGLSVNRQWIVSILLEVMAPPNYDSEDIIYLYMFIARNLPKFPQFILLPGHVLNKVLTGLCEYPSDDVAEDCQLSVEYLLSTYQPPDLRSLIPIFEHARFYRVLKSIYRAEKQYAKLLRASFDDRDQPDDVYRSIETYLRPGSGLTKGQVEDFRAVIVDHSEVLLSISIPRTASVIEKCAPDLHSTILMGVSDNDAAQFEYLRTVLELSAENGDVEYRVDRPAAFVEHYIRLLCHFDPSHVRTFIEGLNSGDLRLVEVLPALEETQVIDALVILLAREGQIREGILRLIRHLQTLKAALIGLLESSAREFDVNTFLDSSSSLVSSIQQYARVGIWLCQEYTPASSRSKVMQSSEKTDSELSQLQEDLWVDLIDCIVIIMRDVNEAVENSATISDHAEVINTQQITTQLRSIVQEAFTAVLNATTGQKKGDKVRSDRSFLRILRAFLDRASKSSPSLSSLRGVLSAIFSAYSYEEELITLSNKLLDKDLFVHVAEVDRLRRRGWRPLGQICEACGKRLWGPGAGGQIWEAWQEQNEQRDSRRKMHASSSAIPGNDERGKGKDVTTVHDENPPQQPHASYRDEDEAGTIVIFACRHIFHRDCLMKMQADRSREGDEATDILVCPLEFRSDGS